jgi:GIY-YIG catalytic domain
MTYPHTVPAVVGEADRQAHVRRWMGTQHASHIDVPSEPGVYAIRNTRTGTCYVGSSANIATHVATHIHRLSVDTHDCAALQAAWNTDGEAAFEFTVLELVTHLAQLPACERYWVNTLCPLGLYNADHSLHPGRLPEVGGDLSAPPTGDPAHVKTPYIRVNAVIGVQRSITQEECRAVFQSRPLVRNVLRRVLAEAYMREHPESHEVMHSILEDWERHA